jgi:hypothetical protein
VFWAGWDCSVEVGCGAGDEGAGWEEDVRAGAESMEEGADEEGEAEGAGSRLGSGGAGISDRDEFRPASTC